MKWRSITILLTVALIIIVMYKNYDTIGFLFQGLPSEPIAFKEYLMPHRGGNENKNSTKPFPVTDKYRLYIFEDEQESMLVWMRKKWYGWKMESKHSQNNEEYVATWKIYTSGRFTYINQDIRPDREICQKVFILCETSKIAQWEIRDLPRNLAVSAVSTDSNFGIDIGEEIPGYTLIEATTYDSDNYCIENMEQHLCRLFGLEYAAICISDIRE